MSLDAAATWLLDLGNSRVKLARLEEGAPAGTWTLDWNHDDFDATLRARLASWPRPGRVLLASVAAPARAERLQRALALPPDTGVEWLRSPRRACGVTNRYRIPARLGIDRFLSMVAVHARVAGPSVVVGCGTALTLDAVAADGAHAKGMIALSPRRMLDTLRGATAIEDGNPDAFTAREAGGDDTAAALTAGCWAAAGSLVEWFLARHGGAGAATPLWLHGGWAADLAAWLAREGYPAQVLDYAVLHGLARWADGADVE